MIPWWNRAKSAIRLRRTFGVLMFARKNETSRCASRSRNPRSELRWRKIGCRLLRDGLIAFSVGGSGSDLRSRDPQSGVRWRKIGCRLLRDGPIAFSDGGSGSDSRLRSPRSESRRLVEAETALAAGDFCGGSLCGRASAGIAGKGRSSDGSCLCRLERPDAKSVNTRDAGVGDKSIRCLFYGCVAHYNTST